ncbi:MAG: hypothetical protein CVU81_03210 [Euryarchaeota archaeon HGW-Euryarchaeota-1]|nr:MAG: hypothetical protein CVU81_03210 [Euryarchaeota archaeon HGW-Euryarchaeota-1]
MSASEFVPKIIIDSREFRSPVTRALALLGAKIEMQAMDVGDYVCSCDVVVERKEIGDFISSILDNRLFAQMAGLRKANSPILIIEGTNFNHNLNPNSFFGAIASVAVDFKIPIVWMQNGEESARFLFQLAKREQFDLKKEVSVRCEKQISTIKDNQEFFVAGLPNVNSVLAKRLLEKFKTPRKIVDASEEKLQKVEGIGKKKAEQIRKVLDTKFQE